jgi:Na+/proline symporter
LGNLVPYTTDQAVIQRYLTTPDEKQAAKSVWTNAVLTIPASVIFFGLGTALFVFYKTRPELLNPAQQTDAIFPWFIVQQLPAGISGLVIAGLFAAAMSTLDSSLNSVSTAIVTDFYRRSKPGAADGTCLKLARALTVLLGAVAAATACLMATYQIKSLWDLYLGLVGLLGGSLAGVFVLGIFTRRGTGSGSLVGVVLSVLALFFVRRYTSIHFLLYAPIGIVSCSVTGYMVSLVMPAPPKGLEGLTIFSKGPGKARQ